MAVVLVTYDLKAPGRNYQPVYDYLKTFTWCKDLESVWLLDTTTSTQTIRDELQKRVDGNDKVFVVRLTQTWNSLNFGCAEWLNRPGRGW